MLRSLLDTHSVVIVPPEYPILLRVMNPFREQKFKTIHQKKWLYEQLTSFKTHENRFYDTLGLNEDHLRDLIVQHKETLFFQQGFQYFIQCCTSVRINGEPVLLGDKNPVYSFFFNTLMKKFSGAKMIFIVRDPRQQFVSLKKFDFEMTIPFLQAARWRIVTQRMLKAQALFPDRIVLVRYEDLVSDPEKILRGICRFLGTDFDPEMLLYYQYRPKHIDEKADTQFRKFHSSLTTPIMDDKIDQWKTALSVKEIRSIEWTAGKIMKMTGYETTGPSFSIFLVLKSAFWNIYAYCMLGFMHLPLLLPPGYRSGFLNFIYNLSKFYHRHIRKT